MISIPDTICSTVIFRHNGNVQQKRIEEKEQKHCVEISRFYLVSSTLKTVIISPHFFLFLFPLLLLFSFKATVFLSMANTILVCSSIIPALFNWPLLFAVPHAWIHWFPCLLPPPSYSIPEPTMALQKIFLYHLILYSCWSLGLKK